MCSYKLHWKVLEVIKRQPNVTLLHGYWYGMAHDFFNSPQFGYW